MSYQAYDDDSISLDKHSSFLDDHLSRYQWIKELVKGKKVLDCACGKGYGSYLISLSASEVTGIDLNSISLEIAQQRFPSGNLKFEMADVLKLVEKYGKNQFDVVVAFEIIEHIPHETTDLFLSEIAKVLKPDGMLILSTPNHDVAMKSGVHIPDFHINNFRPTELKRFLKNHFSKVKMIGQYTQRGLLNQLLFSFDFFNLRHLFKKTFFNHQINLSNSVEDGKVNGDFTPIDTKFLDQYYLMNNQYQYSSRHWRQAGLTMAIARGKLVI